MKLSTIYYVHDPMCSWCWGFSKTYEKFIEKLSEQFEVKRLLGGLAADSDVPMDDKTKLMVQNAWQTIEQKIPGIKFNFDFWTSNIPQRSTYPACRAVIAARKQGELFDVRMTGAIQTAYYKNAQNPSDTEVLSGLAEDIELNMDLFMQDIHSADTQSVLLNEIKQVRRLKVRRFPSLIQQINQSFYSIPVEYLDESIMIKALNSNLHID